MAERFTPKECRSLLAELLKTRPDLGLWKWMANMALEPPDPFKPWEQRRPKKGFVFAALLLAFTTAWFIYFNAWL